MLIIQKNSVHHIVNEWAHLKSKPLIITGSFVLLSNKISLQKELGPSLSDWSHVLQEIKTSPKYLILVLSLDQTDVGIQLDYMSLWFWSNLIYEGRPKCFIPMFYMWYKWCWVNSITWGACDFDLDTFMKAGSTNWPVQWRLPTKDPDSMYGYLPQASAGSKHWNRGLSYVHKSLEVYIFHSNCSCTFPTGWFL